jgi:hypothetical protein
VVDSTLDQAPNRTVSGIKIPFFRNLLGKPRIP